MRRHGLTLLEVVLASAIMLTLCVALAAVFRMGWGAQRTSSGATDVYRACMVAQSHLRSDLKGIEVLSPTDSTGVTTLYYRHSRFVNGNLEVDLSGEPVWAGEVKVWTDPEGRLLSQETGQPVRILARLGTGGRVTFTRTAQHLLEVVIHAERPDKDRPGEALPFEVKDTVYLPNQG